MAFVHYILTFHWVLVDNHRSETLRHTLIDCIQALGECQFFNLETIPRGVCIDTIPFMSFAISQPSGADLGFPILIGPAGCPESELGGLRTVNMCFNLQSPLGGFIFPD